MAWLWLLVPLAYLLGSISSAVIVSRIMGLPDPRSEGSKNPGTTNVLRLGGKKAAIITLLGDVAKGLLPAIAVKLLAGDSTVLACVAVAAFVGHLFPVFFGFKGGKGVATALGVLLGVAWPLGLSLLATWIAVAGLTRFSSLAALLAALLAPVYAWLFLDSLATRLATVVIAGLLVWRHSANIQRLLAGEESKIGQKAV